eukprot:7339688-Prymnesium_polylepis.3
MTKPASETTIAATRRIKDCWSLPTIKSQPVRMVRCISDGTSHQKYACVQRGGNRQLGKFSSRAVCFGERGAGRRRRARGRREFGLLHGSPACSRGGGKPSSAKEACPARRQAIENDI